jgi:predicted dehydrogenase
MASRSDTDIPHTLPDGSPTVAIGVIGCGRLGTYHARAYSRLPEAELIAVHDSDPSRADLLDVPPSVHRARSIEDLVVALEKRRKAGQPIGISVATPTVFHRAVAEPLLERGIPVLVEKPLAHTLADAKQLVEAATRGKVPLMVGHIERFNPAIRAVADRIGDPGFVEIHRLSPFPFRSLDIGVVLDLMIHDIDIVLSLVRSRVSRVDATGIAVISPVHEDLANARFAFETGAVANITASRVSNQTMRRVRVFSRDSYTTMDFVARSAWVYTKTKDFDLTKIDPATVKDPKAFLEKNLLQITEIKIDPVDALETELREFLRCARSGDRPLVAGEDGVEAIRVADEVLTAIRSNPWTGTGATATATA